MPAHARTHTHACAHRSADPRRHGLWITRLILCVLPGYNYLILSPFSDKPRISRDNTNLSGVNRGGRSNPAPGAVLGIAPEGVEA